jgi:hypothetical protein
MSESRKKKSHEIWIIPQLLHCELINTQNKRYVLILQCKSFKPSLCIYKKKFEDIKGVIRTRKSMKDRQSYCQKKKDKVAMIYKPLHRKLNIEEHEPH